MAQDPFDLKVCVPMKTAPYLFMEDGQPAGIDMDILTQLVQRLYVRASLEVVSLSDLMSHLAEGRCELALGVNDNPDFRNQADFIFTIPLYYTTTTYFTLKSSPPVISTIGQFFDQKIAHRKNKSVSIGLEQAIRDQRLERLTFDALEQGIKLLQKGFVDGVLAEDVAFRYLLKTARVGEMPQVQRVSLPLFPHIPSFLALSSKMERAKRQKMKQDLSDILRQLHLEGTLSNIMKSYVY